MAVTHQFERRVADAAQGFLAEALAEHLLEQLPLAPAQDEVVEARLQVREDAGKGGLVVDHRCPPSMSAADLRALTTSPCTGRPDSSRNSADCSTMSPKPSAARQSRA